MNYYILYCENCHKKEISFSEIQLQRRAEDHMMEYGHIVNIEEL